METDYVLGFEEVVADAMETMLTDGNLVEKLAKLKKQDKTIWQKIKDFIDNWAAKIREAYEGLSPDSTEGRMVAEMVDSIDQLQQLFAEGLVEASENYKAGQDKASKEAYPAAMAASRRAAQADRDLKAEIKYSLRDVKIPKRTELEKKDPIKVVDISVAQTTGRFADRRKEILKMAKDIISKPYLNKDTKTLIFLTNNSYTHAFNNLGELQLNAAEHIPELIENAVLTHAEKPTHGSQYTDGVYTFFAAAKAEQIMPVKLKVKEYNYVGQLLPKNIQDYFNNNPGDYAMSYDTVVLEVDEIEESPSGSARDNMKHDADPGPEELLTIKVAELLDLVKGDAEKYIPKLSDRATDSVSNRSLLANALESAAVNDIERKRLQEYKAKIAEVQAEEEKLRELNLLLNAENDPKRMRQIQLEAKQAANRITIFDKQLLRLEATRPLQDVLKREQKAAYDRGVQKGKENMED